MTLSPMSNQWTESCEFYNFAASEAEEFYPADPKKREKQLFRIFFSSAKATSLRILSLITEIPKSKESKRQQKRFLRSWKFSGHSFVVYHDFSVRWKFRLTENSVDASSKASKAFFLINPKCMEDERRVDENWLQLNIKLIGKELSNLPFWRA